MTQVNRKTRRKWISPIRLHSKAFEKSSLKETVLSDGSIMFNIEWFASTVDKDYDGDVILPEGIITERYMKNPIIKNQHGRGLGTNLGKATTLKVVAGEWLYMECEVILHPEIAEHKSIIHGLRHGLINGFSIWFGHAKYQMVDDQKQIVSLELHEVSLVDIPNNPSTVRKMLEVAKTVAEVDEDENLSTDDDEEADDLDAGDANEDEGDDEDWNEDQEDQEEDIEADSTVVAGDADGDADAGGDDATDTSDDKTIKSVVLDSDQLPVIGSMYRVKFTEEMEWRGDVYCWDSIYNCECVKIAEIKEDEAVTGHEAYWLVYTMEFDGWKPTTYTVKTNVSETMIMELTEEQLKELWSITNVNKDIEEDTNESTDDTDSEDGADPVIAEWSDEAGEVDSPDWQDNDDLWNEVEEASDWNNVDDPNGSQEDDKGIKSVDTLQKSLDEAKELLSQKDIEIAELKADAVKNDEQAIESAKAIESLVATVEKLNEFVDRAKNNYRTVWKAFDSSDGEDSTKSTVEKRAIHANR